MASESPHPLSMTGFGQGHGRADRAELEVQVRAVNHRHADVRLKVCPELAHESSWLEDRVRSAIRRGRAEVSVSLQAAADAGMQLDTALARSVYAELVALRDELDPGQPVPLSVLTGVPGLFRQGGRLDGEEAHAALEQALEGALASLNAMRKAEGAALVDDLRRRLERIEEHVRWVQARSPQVVEAARQKLRARVAALLERTASAATPDEGRLEQEIAVLADRTDIAEETTRLSSHIVQFAQQLEVGHEPVGRKLDFLLQEMNREVNTIGSKASDAAMAQRVVDLKAELERLREQVQNIL